MKTHPTNHTREEVFKRCLSRRPNDDAKMCSEEPEDTGPLPSHKGKGYIQKEELRWNTNDGQWEDYLCANQLFHFDIRPTMLVPITV